MVGDIGDQIQTNCGSWGKSATCVLLQNENSEQHPPYLHLISLSPIPAISCLGGDDRLEPVPKLRGMGLEPERTSVRQGFSNALGSELWQPAKDRDFSYIPLIRRWLRELGSATDRDLLSVFEKLTREEWTN